MERAMILIQLLLLLLLQFKNTESANTFNITKPGCPESCEGSDISIPYPFGIGQNCSMSEEFVVNCENSTNGIPSPSRGIFMIENIDLRSNQAHIKLAIASSCGSTPTTTNFSNNEPFRLNTEENKFVVVGCNTLAYLHLDNSTDYLAGCFSSCGSQHKLNKYGYFYGNSYENFCSGIGCCQTDIPKGTSTFYATFDEALINNSKEHNSSRCSYAMVVDAASFRFDRFTIGELANSMVMANQTMPIVLDWAVGNTTCKDAQTNKSSYACRSDHSVCSNSTSSSGGYFCNCLEGYEGNPYLDEGCQDIDECADQNPCSMPGKCHNLQGTYRCSCFFGWSTNDDKLGCHLNVAIVIGTTIPLGFIIACSIIFLCIAIAKRINLFKKRKQEKLRKKFFDQNQGSLLQQLIASNEEATQNTRILTIQELKKATNGFDNALILGRGGHGYVYKGIFVVNKKKRLANLTEKTDCKEEEEKSERVSAAKSLINLLFSSSTIHADYIASHTQN